jgi:uncharacterized protein (TIGR03083 family)
VRPLRGIDEPDRARVLEACEARGTEIADALGALDDGSLEAPSELPGWSRLTIACHLRYGAEALSRMTSSALEGAPAAFYPEGRSRQRPRTLEAGAGECPRDVVRSLRQAGDALQRTWRGLSEADWHTVVEEPEDNPDLGTVDLAWLPFLRLTELEVHGSDLRLDVGEWSETFVRLALPTRLAWLNTRRSNHRSFDAHLDGSWLLAATDGPAYRVEVHASSVDSRPVDSTARARATIVGSSRDLLALLLGRPGSEPLRIIGDAAFARRFGDAFPGP